MPIRFVEPQKATLTLADGSRLTVRHELNAGEELEMSSKIRREPEAYGFTLAAAYLLDWTAEEDIRGLTPSELEPILRRLSFDTILEIKQAIDTHRATVAAAIEEKKSNPATVSA
jgi:hypothetical protein